MGIYQFGTVLVVYSKMVLDASLLNTQPYKVRMKGKVGKFWERSSTLLHVLVWLLSKRELSGHPSVIPKTRKMILNASLLNTQPYKVRIEGKVEISRERSSVLPYILV